MNRSIVLVILSILFVGLGIYFFLRKQVPINNQGNNAPVQDMDESGTPEISGGKYIMYSNGILSSTNQYRRVLFFYANWCPTCRPANESFQTNAANIPEDVVVIRVNYNDSDTDQEEKDLAKEYGIGYQHTFVQIDSEGNQVNLWNGGGFDEMLKRIK